MTAELQPVRREHAATQDAGTQEPPRRVRQARRDGCCYRLWREDPDASHTRRGAAGGRITVAKARHDRTMTASGTRCDSVRREARLDFSQG